MRTATARLRNRTGIAVLLLVAMLVPVLATVTSLSATDQDSPQTGLDPVQARQHAVQSCQRAMEFEDAVRSNAAARDALARLDEAEGAAKLAADLDPVWVRLRSGVQTLRLALESDDPAVADQGLALVRQECGALRP